MDPAPEKPPKKQENIIKINLTDGTPEKNTIFAQQITLENHRSPDTPPAAPAAPASPESLQTDGEMTRVLVRARVTYDGSCTRQTPSNYDDYIIMIILIIL